MLKLRELKTKPKIEVYLEHSEDYIIDLLKQIVDSKDIPSLTKEDRKFITPDERQKFIKENKDFFLRLRERGLLVWDWSVLDLERNWK